MVSFVNVAEMIYFDAVKANVTQKVIESMFRLSQRLCLLPSQPLLSMSLLSLPQSHHANDLHNPN